MAGLERLMPAQPDEFAIVVVPDPATDDAKKTQLQKLQARLLYVQGMDQYFDQEQHELIPSDHALYHRFACWFPKGNTRVDVARKLAESNARNIVDHATFHPGEGDVFVDRGKSYVNLYRPNHPAPLPATPEEGAMIEWLFNRIDDELFRKYLLQFYGHVVQHPGVKIRSAPLIWSTTQGNGKTIMMSKIPRALVSSRYSQEVSFNAMEEKFNGYMLSKWHLCFTELKVGNKMQADAVMARIKPWITDDYIEVRAMRTDTIDMQNHLIITANSNKPDALLLDNNDRRFAVCHLSAPRMTPEEGRRVGEWIDSERGAAVLRWYFERVDLTGFSPSAPAPETEARAAMIAAAKGDDIEELEAMMAVGEGVFARDAGRVVDIQAQLRARFKYTTSANKISAVLEEQGAMRRSLKPHGSTTTLNVWIWRDHGKWISVPQKTLLEYVDINSLAG
jgi:hypothetical protein